MSTNELSGNNTNAKCNVMNTFKSVYAHLYFQAMKVNCLMGGNIRATNFSLSGILNHSLIYNRLDQEQTYP